jgi:hypothetical protein
LDETIKYGEATIKVMVKILDDLRGDYRDEMMLIQNRRDELTVSQNGLDLNAVSYTNPSCVVLG